VAAITLEPLSTTEAHVYWRTFVSGRSDLPTADLKIHLDRYLSLPPEEQRAHFSIKRDGQIVGTILLKPGGISGFSMAPSHEVEARSALLRAIDLLRAAGSAAVTAQFEDRYEDSFASLGFRRVFARMRMEAPTRKAPLPTDVRLQPPEEGEVLGLTAFLMNVYEGHMEQRFGLHTGPEEEWREYVAAIFKGETGRYMPDASYVCLDANRIVGAILVSHWMGMPLVAELGVAKDRRRRGMGRALLQAAMNRLVDRDEPTLALYVTVGNDPAIVLYRDLKFVQVGGQSVTARLETQEDSHH
jgi:ribosomal protein S18 acetylase RimI-like enzyme